MRKIRDRKSLASLLPRGGIAAEIGVQRGRFAKVLYRRAKPQRLHLIDCWQHQDDEKYDADTANVSDLLHEKNYRRTQQRLAAGIRCGRVQLHRGYSVPTLAAFNDQYFDWVYVDANHTYEGVTADLEACLPKMKIGGLICGHDYINSPYWRHANYGVVEAVDDFCQRHNWRIICLTREPGNEIDKQGNPSYVLRHADFPDDILHPQVRWPWRAVRRAA